MTKSDLKQLIREAYEEIQAEKEPQTAHAETDETPAESKEVQLAQQIKALADELLAMHQPETEEPAGEAEEDEKAEEESEEEIAAEESKEKKLKECITAVKPETEDTITAKGGPVAKKYEETKKSCECGECDECMAEAKKWIQKAIHPSREGMFADKGIGDLKDMLKAAHKKSESHKEKGETVPKELRKKMSQLVFAIRAKQSGGLKKGSEIKED